MWCLQSKAKNPVSFVTKFITRLSAPAQAQDYCVHPNGCSAGDGVKVEPAFSQRKRFPHDNEQPPAKYGEIFLYFLSRREKVWKPWCHRSAETIFMLAPDFHCVYFEEVCWGPDPLLMRLAAPRAADWHWSTVTWCLALDGTTFCFPWQFLTWPQSPPSRWCTCSIDDITKCYKQTFAVGTTFSPQTESLYDLWFVKQTEPTGRRQPHMIHGQMLFREVQPPLRE